MKDIFDANYWLAKRVFKYFEIKNLGEWNYLFVQNETLLLTNVLNNLWNMCIEIHGLDPAHVPFAPRSEMQITLKKSKVKSDLLVDIDRLLVVEKSIRGGIYSAIHRYAEAQNEFMKFFDKNKESLHLNHLDVSSLYGLIMSQKLPVDGLK